MKSLVIKLPKKLSREAAARLGSERVAPGQAVPLHPEAVAFAGHYGFDRHRRAVTLRHLPVVATDARGAVVTLVLVVPRTTA